MDDILLLHVETPGFDHVKFTEEFCKSECYRPPLALEDGGEDTFLETTFEITETNKIRYWLKNVNKAGEQPKIWRYAHFASYAPFEQKRAVLMASLRKVHKMASDKQARITSARQKLMEFERLEYPRRMIWTACTTMGVTTRDTAWFRVRETWD